MDVGGGTDMLPDFLIRSTVFHPSDDLLTVRADDWSKSRAAAFVFPMMYKVVFIWKSRECVPKGIQMRLVAVSGVLTMEKIHIFLHPFTAPQVIPGKALQNISPASCSLAELDQFGVVCFGEMSVSGNRFPAPVDVLPPPDRRDEAVRISLVDPEQFVQCGCFRLDRPGRIPVFSVIVPFIGAQFQPFPRVTLCCPKRGYFRMRRLQPPQVVIYVLFVGLICGI